MANASHLSWPFIVFIAVQVVVITYIVCQGKGTLVWTTIDAEHTCDVGSNRSRKIESANQLLGAVQASRRHTQRQACSSLGLYDNQGFESLKGSGRIYVSRKHKALFFLVPKSSSTSWARVLLIIEGVVPPTKNMTPHEIVEASKKYLKHLRRYKESVQISMLRSYTTIVFVRNPYTRLLSAFRDKLESFGSKMGHRAIHNKIIYTKYEKHPKHERPKPSVKNEMYNGTFKGFVDYVLSGREKDDVHWRELHSVIPPCVSYDFIGKIETYADDFNQIVNLIGAESKVRLVNAGHTTGSSEDAILRQYYATLSTKQLEGLRHRFSTDMKLFGYSIPKALKGL